MLDIHLSLLIFTAAIFLFLVFALNEILYRPLLEFMQRRDESIKNDLENISNNDEAIQNALNEANEIISQAKAQAAKIKEDAVKKAKESAQKELEEQKTKFENSYNEFLKELNQDKIKLKKELSANIATYQKILKDKLKAI